jgi:GNAT superfamily N-acetyltransferase
MTLQFRPCREADFENVLGLLRQLWPGKEINISELRNAFVAKLAEHPANCCCAMENGCMVAFASFSLKPSLRQEGLLGNIDEFVVDAECRGKGVGSQLLEYILTDAKARGCSRVELESGFPRKEAHAFYEHRGFVNRAYFFSRAL